MPTPTQTTAILQIREMAPDVREIVLAGPPEPIDFEPGQWLSLHLPVGEKPPLVRAYSLARPMEPAGTLTLCLDRVADGLGSGYLFGQREGDRLVVGTALGNFKRPEPLEADLLWVARYTGIVPFRCMLLGLPAIPPGRRIRLVYGAHRPEDLVYHAELFDRARRDPQFEYHPTVLEPAAGWSGEVGTELELLERLADLPGMRDEERGTSLTHSSPLIPMVCGVKAFTRPAREFFQERGFERRAVRVEHYD